MDPVVLKTIQIIPNKFHVNPFFPVEFMFFWENTHFF